MVTMCGAGHWVTLLDTRNGNEVFIGDPLVGKGGWVNINKLEKESNIKCIKK